MIDINDLIKEIIYRSADECNFNNEELNFHSILKFFYDITNKYKINKKLSDEILNKLLIICKNIIDDKINCKFENDDLNENIREININNSSDSIIKEKLSNYKNYDYIPTFHIEKNDKSKYDGSLKNTLLRKKDKEDLSIYHSSKTSNISIFCFDKKEENVKSCKKLYDDNNYTKLIVSEKSFLHKNNKNLLKIFLNGDIISNVYNKIIKHNKYNNDKTQKKNKMKLYNESNVFYTYYTLKKFMCKWLNYYNKEKILKKNFLKFSKIYRKNLLCKYYDLWCYYNEKNIYLKNVHEKLLIKKKKSILEIFFNKWINKYKKKKKKHFIYFVHIFNEWKYYAQKRKKLKLIKSKIEQRRKKCFLMIWKNKYSKKKKKKNKHNEIKNVYNKNLLIKCYVHLILYYKKKKIEHNNYNIIHNKLKKKLYHKYFYLFLEVYQEEIYFKEYYDMYLDRIRIYFLKKFFYIINDYTLKCKNLKMCFDILDKKEKKNILGNYFVRWKNIYNKKVKTNELLKKYIEKKEICVLKKYFFYLKKYKNKTTNLKKKFLYLYERKNKLEIQKIFKSWKNYYSLNSTKYIFLYNKYKYKLLIYSFHFLRNYKNYKIKRKEQILHMNRFFHNRLKKKVLIHWKFYISKYRKNILNYYNFNDESNLFVFFILKLLIKYQIICKKGNCRTFFDFVNFSNINININSLIYIHKKYFTKKNISQNTHIFYENIMYVYKSLNIIFSFIPVLFVVNINKLKFNLPYISFSIKMVIYKRVFDTWLSESRSLKNFKNEMKMKLLKMYFINFYLLIQKKKKLKKIKCDYDFSKTIILKRKTFSTWMFLRIKYFSFRKKFQIYDRNNKHKKMKKIFLNWKEQSKQNSLKKKRIVQFFKNLLMKRKKKCFDILYDNVNKSKEKKIKNKISNLYCMKKYKKKAFKALCLYTKNILYFKILDKISENYLKGICIIKWRNMTKHFLRKKEELQNRINYYNLKIQRKFFNILLIYVHSNQLKKKKFLQYKKIQSRIWMYKYFNEWKKYIKIRKNKNYFHRNIEILFNSKKKLSVLSKWYTLFIINIKFKEVEKIICMKFYIFYFSKLYFYNKKMKRIEFFLKNRLNVMICQGILKEWNHYVRIKKVKKVILEKKKSLMKEKYFQIWQIRYKKVRKRKIEEKKIYNDRQLKRMNILKNIYYKWKNKYLENKKIKIFVCVINNYLLNKLKYRTLLIIYKNNEYYSKLQLLLNHFLLDKSNKLKRYILHILKSNKNSRIKNKKSFLFYCNNMKRRIFTILRNYKEKRIIYKKNVQILKYRKKQKIFYALINFYNFIKKVKTNFYHIHLNAEYKIKKNFFTYWFNFLMRRKKEREIFDNLKSKRENKIKEEIFFEIKRKINKKKRIFYLLNKINQLIKNKMYKYGIYKLEIYRKYAKIQEKLYLKLRKRLNKKTLNKCFEIMKIRIMKKKRRESEHIMIKRFYENLIKKKYMKIISAVCKEKMKKMNHIIQIANKNNIMNYLKRYFVIWNNYIKKIKEYKIIDNIIKLKKKARIFFILLYMRIQNNYNKISIIYSIHKLFYSKFYEIPSFNQIIEYNNTNSEYIYENKYQCVHNIITKKNNNEIIDKRNNINTFNIKPKPDSSIKTLNAFLNLKNFIILNKIYISMDKNFDDSLRKKYYKRNDNFNNFLNICYILRKNIINRLVLNYMLMYDFYDIYKFFIHFKKKFKILYIYIFNLLSVRTKKLLLNFFKKNTSLYFIKIASMKDEEINKNFKILLFIYYIFSFSFTFNKNNKKLNYSNIYFIINHIFVNEGDNLQTKLKTKENYKKKNNIKNIIQKKEIINKRLLFRESNQIIDTNNNDKLYSLSESNSSLDMSYLSHSSYLSSSSSLVKNEENDDKRNLKILPVKMENNFTKNSFEKNMIIFFKKLQSCILSNFKENNLNIKFSFLLRMNKDKLIHIYLFFKKLKKSLFVWKDYCILKKERKKIDILKINKINDNIRKELLEKYFGTWILSFNKKVKEIKTKRKKVLRKHIHLLLIYWYKLIKVSNYDKTKFYELKGKIENRLKSIYFKKIILFYKKKIREKKIYEIIEKDKNNKTKQCFFYVWLLLYQYEKKIYFLSKKINSRLLKMFFCKWQCLYEDKQTYGIFINVLNQNILKKIFNYVIYRFNYYHFIKKKKHSLQKKYFLIFYNIIKKNQIFNKLQIYIYSSLQYKKLSYLFFFWYNRYKKKSSCKKSYLEYQSKKKYYFFNKWIFIFVENKKIYDKKREQFCKFFLKIYWNKWRTFYRYKKLKNKKNENLLKYHYLKLRKKYQMNLSINTFINKNKKKLESTAFNALKEYKNFKKNSKSVKEYCQKYNNKYILTKYYHLWLSEYNKLQKIKSAINHLIIINNKKHVRVIVKYWLQYTKKKKNLRNIYEIIKHKNNKIIKIIFYKWRNLFHFIIYQKHRIMGKYFNIWIFNFKFVLFINKINIYFYNIYQNNIFYFYFILKKKNENFNLLQNGSFFFIKKQLESFLDYKKDLLYKIFTSINTYTKKNITLRNLLENYKLRVIDNNKRKYFSILLKYKDEKKKKEHLNNLFLKYIIERKFIIYKKYFFIITNLYFYKNHLKFCEETIETRKNKRTLHIYLNKWINYNIYFKENLFLQNLCDNFLSYRRKCEFIISLKQFYIENKWKNYCEYNSLIFYKKIQENTLVKLIRYWNNGSYNYFEKKKKVIDIKQKYNFNVMKKYFFLLIFSINKIKIEKKNYDIVIFKKNKTIKQKFFNMLYDITMKNLNHYENIKKLSDERMQKQILKKYFYSLFYFLQKKKILKNNLLQIKNINNVNLIKRYFYIFIFKYVNNINHYKYYYYNKYLSIWKYYIVIKRNKNDQEETDDEEVDGNYGNFDYDYDEYEEDEDKKVEEKDKIKKNIYDGNSESEKNIKEIKENNSLPFDNNISNSSSEYTLKSNSHLNKNDIKNENKNNLTNRNIISINSYIDSSSETREESDISKLIKLNKNKLKSKLSESSNSCSV
ncbi:conserved Plasmodium protein, unknown function [Plasmodium gallinaceum]|uniref:Uncharacterized protein n=1 Tax=Plasmodium gallinaceum TaxID=5849 RepID=A0A1J1H0H5_PLAGA|nr:conserved Plasmodium protein, unknown function [Plasmodium gallinaceum]CRG98067.1 conserved Plasmodium protein, unknown function [Plasmodium gallinaceum]